MKSAGRPERKSKAHTKRRGRPPNICADNIIAAALEIGFRDISKHAIARKLGVAVSALYRHVGSREELLLMCTDIVSQRVKLPKSDSWQNFLCAMCRNYRNVTLSMPGSVEFVREVGLTTPAACAVVDRTIGVLKKAGFRGDLAYMCCIGMISHATDMVLHEKEDARNAELRAGAEAESVLRTMKDRYANIGWALADDFALDREAYFDLGLKIYIDGIELSLREQRAGRRA